MDLSGKGGREELVGVEGGENAIRIYCMIIESSFNEGGFTCDMKAEGSY